MKYFFFDTEYRRSYEPSMQVLCLASLSVSDKYPRGLPWVLWINGDEKVKESLRGYLLSIKDTHILVCFNASAEARALISIGLNPRDFHWIDLFLEWKIATNNHLDFMYGKIRKGPNQYITSRPIFEGGDGVSHEKVGSSYAAMVLALLDIDIDTDKKERMYDLILNQTTWTTDESKKILEYCFSDVVHMPDCLDKLPQKALDTFLSDALARGRWSVNLAVIENTGIPVDLDKIFSFGASYEGIKDTIIKDLNKVYPFYVWTKKTKKKYEWVKSYGRFVELIKRVGLYDVWPRTKSLQLSTDDDTLKEYRGIPEIEALRNAQKILRQAQWYRPEAIPEFLDHTGSDGRVRASFRPFGTATGRNAPQAKFFLFAQAKWTRSLITPPPGKAISGIDYSSQEIAIAAALSGDKAMIEAYNSGDPYIAFAIQAQAAPPDATKVTHETVRDLFKAAVLAVQFGMGIESLAYKISANTKKPPDFDQAADLLDMHKEIYWRYHEWLEEMEMDFRSRGYIRLFDGHLLWLSNDLEKKILSVRNHPVQGTGAVILRLAVDYALDAGLKVVAPLHDAIYHEHDISATDEANAVLKACMDRAVYTVFGDLIRIRNDVKTVRHGELWLEKGADKQYELMRKYLESDDGVLLKMSIFDGRE